MLKFSVASRAESRPLNEAQKKDFDKDSDLCLPKPAGAPATQPQQRLLLYYITERRQLAGMSPEKERRLIDKISECAAAGVDFIQLREKDLSTREQEVLAGKAIAAIPPGSATKLLINSRIDVALACGAHGVHLPANSLSASEARSIFARAGISYPVIAVSTHSAEAVAAAESHGADFAVFGPVFEKGGVANRSGLEQLAAASRRAQSSNSPMPVLAVGGVTLDNAALCLAAGAAGIAAIRLFQEGEVMQIVEKLRRAGMGPAAGG
jgi:thiamine-phosphate pyrophosphorylase